MTRLPARGDDRGMTLAETLVGAVLLIVVTALASTLLITGQRAAADTADRGESAESQRVAYDSLTRILRTATAVRLAPGTDAVPAVQHGSDGRTVTVIALPDPVAAAADQPEPSRVTFSLDAAGVLTQTVTPAVVDIATGTFTFPAPGGPTERRRILATRVLNSPTEPVFSYAMPRSEPPDTTCTVDEGCAVPLSATGTEASTLTARESVRSIDVTLTMKAAVARDDSTVSFRSRVHLPASGVLRVSS